VTLEDQTRPITGTPEPGDLIADRYEVQALAGTGGMASVYRAHDRMLDRTVALKIFRTDSSTAADLRRQQAEVRTAARLQHHALVTLFDIATDARLGDSPVLVMQYVESVTLHQRLRSGAVDPALVQQIGADVAEALTYLHGQGIIHRDVKPGNILLPTAATPYAAMLSDFGIARFVDDDAITTVGTVMGSAAYLSPEQARGRDIGSATDVYSLGLVLIESLTGQRCFPGSGVESVAVRLHRDPDLPAGLDERGRALLQAMTDRTASRRPTPAEVVEALREPGAFTIHDAVTTPTVAMTAPTPVTATAPATATDPRRRSLVLAVGLAALVLIVAVGAWMLRPVVFPDPAPPGPSVEYPAVDGPLGEDLQRLQDAVTP
jgi:serine/threonine protein kinase